MKKIGTPTGILKVGSTVFYYPIAGTVTGAMRATVVEIVNDTTLKICVIIQNKGRAEETILTATHAKHPRHAGAWDHVQ